MPRHKKYRVLWRRLFGIANRIDLGGEIYVTKFEKFLLLGTYLVKKIAKIETNFSEPLISIVCARPNFTDSAQTASSP